MRKGFNFLAGFILFFIAGPLVADSNRIIEDFSQAPVGSFPSTLKTYPLQRGKAVRVYSVQSEGGKHFLHAQAAGEAQDVATQVFRRFDWDVTQWPRISWRWRAKALPVPPAGVQRHFDDNACGVYIVFGGWGGKAIKYIWSSDLPLGQEKEDTPARFFVIVAKSGSANVGTWQKMTMNVADEYRRLFKKELDYNPDGFGILTDGDGTHSPSVCDYTDFEILAKE